jgi:hypothetical protein
MTGNYGDLANSMVLLSKNVSQIKGLDSYRTALSYVNEGLRSAVRVAMSENAQAVSFDCFVSKDEVEKIFEQLSYPFGETCQNLYDTLKRIKDAERPTLAAIEMVYEIDRELNPQKYMNKTTETAKSEIVKKFNKRYSDRFMSDDGVVTIDWKELAILGMLETEIIRDDMDLPVVS